MAIQVCDCSSVTFLSLRDPLGLLFLNGILLDLVPFETSLFILDATMRDLTLFASFGDRRYSGDTDTLGTDRQDGSCGKFLRITLDQLRHQYDALAGRHIG